jgi:carbon storage regulator CsrA
MLVLTRKADEQIYIGEQIVLSILEVRGNRVRLGIDAPPGIEIVRAELLSHRPAPKAPAIRSGQRRILIVDDCPEDRMMVRRCMAGSQPRFVFSETDLGEQGLRLCREQLPDCILLDYQLPDLNGIEFLSALRKDTMGRNIPVIVFTGQGKESVAVEAMKKGAQDYLVKQEISPEKLRKAIYEAVRLPFVN